MVIVAFANFRSIFVALGCCLSNHSSMSTCVCACLQCYMSLMLLQYNIVVNSSHIFDVVFGRP